MNEENSSLTKSSKQINFVDPYYLRTVKGVVMTRVIVTTRDSSKDYWIPKEEAHKLWDSCQLSFDVTNRAFCKKSK